MAIAFDRAVHDYDLALGRYQETLTRLAAAEQEVIIDDALAKALALDGIPSQMIAEVWMALMSYWMRPPPTSFRAGISISPGNWKSFCRIRLMSH